MGQSARTLCQIDGDFSRISQNFPSSLVFCAPAERVSLRIRYRRCGQKARIMGLPGREKSLTTSSAVWIQCKNQHDRWTDTGRHLRPRLRIASRGKNNNRNVHCSRHQKNWLHHDFPPTWFKKNKISLTNRWQNNNNLLTITIIHDARILHAFSKHIWTRMLATTNQIARQHSCRRKFWPGQRAWSTL